MSHPSDQATNDTEALPVVTKQRADRRTAKLDTATMTITTFEADGTETGQFAITDMPRATIDYCVLAGAWALMRGSDDPAAGYARLKAADLPKPRGGERAVKLDPWRVAIAHALVEHTKKSETPLSLDAATAKAGGFNRAQLLAAKKDPVVVKHFHRLAGTSASASVLALI